MNILFIDNFDSFTFNLVEEFKKRDCKVLIYRNNTDLKTIDNVVKKFKPKLLVISPGPSVPKKAGICIELVRRYFKELPIFGVCLGHQCIVEAFDGSISRCDEIVHGKPSLIQHNGKGIFRNIENPFQGGRYHSLTAVKVPEEFEIIAQTNNIVMAIKHKKYNVIGVQFHPESILTPSGRKLIKNILEEVK